MTASRASVSAVVPTTIDDTLKLLTSADYVADRSLATSVFLALAMKRPLFLEGEAGVGKTEIAKVIAASLGRELIRLQCYEGLDIAQAAYEWNYSRQMIEIRLSEATGEKSKDKLAADIFSERFLIKRALALALEGKPGKAPVLLTSIGCTPSFCRCKRKLCRSIATSFQVLSRSWPSAVVVG